MCIIGTLRFDEWLLEFAVRWQNASLYRLKYCGHADCPVGTTNRHTGTHRWYHSQPYWFNGNEFTVNAATHTSACDNNQNGNAKQLFSYHVDSLFRVLMGDKVETRREFIEKQASEVKNLDV